MESDKQERKRKLGLGLGFVDFGEFAMKRMEMTEAYEEEEEDGDEKVLCLDVFSFDKSLRCYAIDPRGHADGTTSVFGGAATKGILEIEKLRFRDEYHDRIACRSTAVLGPWIYFIGGISTPTGIRFKPVDDVSIYDTVHGTWSKGPSLNVSRAGPAAVIVIDTRIYVFGTFPHALIEEQYDVDIDHWVECYDSRSARWQTISGPKDAVDPPAFLSESAFAVVHFRNEVRFVGKDGYFYVFDTDSNTWKTTCKFTGPKIPFLDFFNCNHVVCGNFAFWLLNGHVYAWDLTNNENSLVGILEDKNGLLRRWSSLCDDDPSPYNSHLVHLGNGFMCIVYWIFKPSRPSYVDCYTFKIEGHPFSSTDEDGACRVVSIGSATLFSFAFSNASILCGVFALSARYSGFPLLET